MAAAPEWEGLGDPEPFSPSVFLNLPRTPQPEGDGGDTVPAPKQEQDNELVLPFISRMLMEEDIDDDNFMYHYPDGTALLQAQQSFAEILFDASSSSTTTTKASGGSVSATPNTFTLSPPSSSDAPVATCWPYDPIELSRLLLSRTHGSTDSFAGREATAAGSAATMTTPAAVGVGDSEHFFSGQNSCKVNMDMLNLAFLKGVEEARKFLPTTTTNSLFIATSVEQDGKQMDGMPLPFLKDSSDGSRKKRHNWADDEFEAEGGRRSKLMAPEPEGSGEVADGVFLKGYQVSLEKMNDLAISSSFEEQANNRSGVVQAQERRQRSSDEEVHLRTLLIHCAQAVSIGNHLSAAELLQQIRRRSSPWGDASQRLAHYFAQGLELRQAGGTGVGAVKPKRTSPTNLLRAYQLHLQVCSFRMVAFKFSHMAINDAVVGRKKVHIVDYGEHHGFQWPLLLGAWATREGGPPEVRITGIDFPQPGFRPAARIQETGRRLTDFARRHGVPFRFRSIVSAKWETVSAEDLDIEPDEVLIVNGLSYFGKLMDEGVDIDSPSPRDMVLCNIRKMRPDVFILCSENSSHGAPFFATRFREALFYYSALFDMMDATAPRDCSERVLVEQVFGQWAMNTIACEGTNRVQRPEAYKQWQLRNNRAGLRQLPLNPETVKFLRKRVKEGYHKDFGIDVDQHWLLQAWKGRILCAMSTWVADDDVIV